jgi:predicted dehydrogenase
MEKVRCGVIGVGGMGSGHCKIMGEIPEVVLTAICDAVPEVVQRVSEQYGVRGFHEPDELLDSDLVDMVIIATPHYFHPPIAEAAFRRGLHVLSEKPIAVSVSEADRMIRAARASGKKFGVMYQMRTEARNRAAKRLIEEGRLGEIYRTNLTMGWYRSQAYYDSGTWRATWSGEGGGVLINQAPHLLDLFTWLGGLPSRIPYSRVRTQLHDIEVEDEAFAVLEYPNGAHGYLYASVLEAPSTEQIEICGDRGKLLLRGGLRFWELDSSIQEFTRTSLDMWGGPKAKEIEVPIEETPSGHGVITQNFARAILNDEPLIAPGEDGLRAVELINGIIMSGKQNRPVDVPVDRTAYDSLLAELQRTSRRKTTAREQRVTDPAFA